MPPPRVRRRAEPLLSWVPDWKFELRPERSWDAATIGAEDVPDLELQTPDLSVRFRITHKSSASPRASHAAGALTVAFDSVSRTVAFDVSPEGATLERPRQGSRGSGAARATVFSAVAYDQWRYTGTAHLDTQDRLCIDSLRISAWSLGSDIPLADHVTLTKAVLGQAPLGLVTRAIRQLPSLSEAARAIAEDPTSPVPPVGRPASGQDEVRRDAEAFLAPRRDSAGSLLETHYDALERHVGGPMGREGLRYRVQRAREGGWLAKTGAGQKPQPGPQLLAARAAVRSRLDDQRPKAPTQVHRGKS